MRGARLLKRQLTTWTSEVRDFVRHEKRQIPNPNTQRNPKLQCPNSRADFFGAWGLELLWSLELGAWSLKSVHASARAPSIVDLGGDLRVLGGGAVNRPAGSIFISDLARRTKRSGLARARRPQNAHAFGIHFSRDRREHVAIAALHTGRASQQSRVSTDEGAAVSVVARSLGV